MTSTEAMIYQLKNLKGKPLKQKLEHIITYFWLPIAVVLAILIFSVSYIVHVATMKDEALNVICLNALAYSEQTQTYMDSFAEAAGIDLEEYAVQLSADLTISHEDMASSYDSVQILVAQVAAQSVDILAADTQTITRYFYQDFFPDLREVLCAQQQEKYAPYYLYMDLAVLEQVQENFESVPEYPDPTKPDAMVEPVPVALMLPEKGDFTTLCYLYAADHAAVSVLGNTENLDNALAFLDYIME